MKNEHNGISADERTMIGMDALSKSERKKLFQKLQGLREVPREQWARRRVRKLKPDEELYVLKAVGDLLVVFSVTQDGQLVIEHLFRQEAVDRFAAEAKEAGWLTAKDFSGSRRN